MKNRSFAALMALLLCACILAGCNQQPGGPGNNNGDGPNTKPTDFFEDPAFTGDESAFGEDLEQLGVYEGLFEGDSANLSVNCLSGTAGCVRQEGNTLIFSGIRADSAYSISGQFRGNIIINVGDSYKFDLELTGFSLICDSAASPVLIQGGDEVTVKAKNGTENYIYDTRDAVDSADASVYAGAIHSEVDLKISGKGSLVVVSENNNGIHSKDDLEVKNLNLTVVCTDNALKGNDSVEITDAATTLIASAGDGIKTTKTDISDKGNQRGTVKFFGGVHTIYAACDGIDAAYNVQIEGEETVVNIYTDKYSNYSSEITAVDSDQYFIRFTDKNFTYSVKFYNSESDFCWVDAQYHSTVPGERSNYYYYSFPRKTEYSKLQVFIYTQSMTQGQEEEYLAATEYLTHNDDYDTFALSSYGNSLGYSWTNYTTKVQEGGFGGPGGPGRPGMPGGGGMGGGNTNKGDHSTKGIKAGNEINVLAGTVNIKSYDDAIHANSGTTLENGKTATGNVIISGGKLTLYSNDDGIHADGLLAIRSGMVNIISSYEGLEGNAVNISGGSVALVASDDGINATADVQSAITVSDGYVYIYCGGDGIDSNCRTNYEGIVFAGGNTVIISSSGMNSAIDTERGYTYYGGNVLAIMPRNGMTDEATHCRDFEDVATAEVVSVSADSYLTVKVDGKSKVTLKMPGSFSAAVIYLGSNSADISVAATSGAKLDNNGVCWH